MCACACHSYAFLSSKHNKPPSQNTTILQEILPVCRSAKMAASQIQLSGIYGGGDTEQNTHKQQRRWGTLNDIFLSNYKMQEKGLKTNNSAHFNDCSKINRIWELTFLRTSDTFAIWTRCWLCVSTKCVISNSLYIFMTFKSGSGGDGGGVKEEIAAKPVTTVQPCVSTFVCEKPLDFLRRPQDISSCVCVNQNRYFKPQHDLFLALPKWRLCLNLTRP